MTGIELYQSERANLQTGDILQWRKHSLIGSLIRWKTGGKFNHTGVVVRMPDLEAGEPRRWTIHAVAKGLAIGYLSTELKDMDGELWLYPVKPEFREKGLKATTWMMERCGTPYDTAGLLTNAIRKVSADARAMFCSEAVFLGWKYAVAMAGFALLGHLINALAPVPDEITEMLRPVLDEPRRIY